MDEVDRDWIERRKQKTLKELKDQLEENLKRSLKPDKVTIPRSMDIVSSAWSKIHETAEELRGLSPQPADELCALLPAMYRNHKIDQADSGPPTISTELDAPPRRSAVHS